MPDSYWSEIANQRLSRRRALAVTGVTLAGAALLAACGSSSSSSGAAGNSSSLVTQPVDTTNQAKRGGLNKWFFTAENATLDIHVAGSPLNTPGCMVYSDLINQKPGHFAPPGYSDFIPDLAESWEISPDRLQVSFKLRSGVKWQNKPPLNGRLLDSDDLRVSWDRFAKQGRTRASIANAADPTAPVLSWSVPDATTLVLKLKEPTVDLLANFGGPIAGKPSIIPKETDTTFDIRHDMIGTGPFILENYTPSVGMTFKRNPDYYDKNQPFIDRVEAPFVLEYAQQLAQFKAGNIYELGTALHPEDILATKRDVPSLRMYTNNPAGLTPGQVCVFGYRPTDANKPFKDERVRQALSMSYDRDAFIDTFYNVSKFKSAGLPLQTSWNSSIGSGAAAFWLDPQGKDFGPNAKYYKNDPATAKQLLAAAGYPNGIDVKSNYISGPELGTSWQNFIQVTEDMARQVGFRPTANLIDYASVYGPVIRDGHGKFDGWGYTSSGPSGTDAVTYFNWRFRTAGQVFLGYDVNGSGDGSGDPYVDQQVLKARGEFDTQARIALLADLQRYLAKAQYCVSNPGIATGFVLAWSVLGNYGVWLGEKRGANYNWWIDDTQPPLRKA